MVAHAFHIVHADDAEESVLHDGICDAGGDVLDCRADLLGMAHARSHEYGAFRAQIDGRGGMKRLLGELRRRAA